MGHSIPVIFFTIGCSQAPATLDSWHDAEALIAAQFSKRDEGNYWSSVSRNWWHQDGVVKIGQRLGIGDLEFTLSEVTILDTGELEAAAKSLDLLLSSFSDGIPDLGPIEPDDGTLWWLGKGIRDDEVIELSKQDVQAALEEAEAHQHVDEGSTVGYMSLVGFFSFLKSLRQAILHAIDARSCLLYVRPQPYLC